MSEPSKAVFLSYASQDAEAAKRIADALRGAGVEVWFDAEGGLEHGDEWDAKIRRQIKECVLFIPVISANTQAREEGYFRIEWDLAAERARGIASGVAFILPAVIDDTKEPTALVPDRFRAVQWTKLLGGNVPPDVLQRFLKLWSHRTGALKGVEAGRPRPAEERGEGISPPKRAGRLLLIGGAIAVAGIAAWFVLRPPPNAPVSIPNSQTSAASVEPSAARQLAAKARALLAAGRVISRETLSAADDLAEQALKLDPTDAEVVATCAQVDAFMVYRGFDISDQRRQSAAKRAQRALALAPTSFEARHARAVVAGFLSSSPDMLAEAEHIYRELRQERPADDVLGQELGRVLQDENHFADAAAVFLQAKQPLDAGWAYFYGGQFQEADKVADRLLAEKRDALTFVLKGYVQLFGFGDLAAAQAAVGQLTPTELLNDDAAGIALRLAVVQRDAPRILRLLDAFANPFLSIGGVNYPKQYWTGYAQQMLSHPEAARSEWRGALQAVQERLKSNSADVESLGWAAVLQALLGEKEAAEQALRLYLNYNPVRPGRWDWWEGLTVLHLGGRNDEVFDRLAGELRRPHGQRMLYLFARSCPEFDPLRADPRLEALLRETLPAGMKPFTATADQPAGAKVDEKSVAVLAFADLSEKHDSEYFSDGISEELLNVLAKVPGLKVSARTSSFHFKGTNTEIPEVARQLGVAYVIEGSVRKQGDKVRITAQLIKAADGFHVWSDTFTRDLKDVFAVQDEIAGLIAQQLSLKLGTASTASAVNPEAYELYLQARAAWNRRDDAGLARAAELLDRALAIAPDFARAHAAQADVWALQDLNHGTLGGFSQRDSPKMQRVLAEAQRAIALEPESAESHASLGNVYLLTWRQRDAIREFRRAIDLNPSYATAHHWLGRALWLEGWIDEAGTELRRAMELDPLSPRILDNNAAYEYALGRYAAALALNERALALQPGALQAATFMVRDLSALGRHDEALKQMRQFGFDHISNLATFAVETLVRAGRPAEAAEILPRIKMDDGRYWALLLLGRREEALVTLTTEDLGLGDGSEILLSPLFDSIREDPRFQQRLTFFGLNESYARGLAWRAAHLPENAGAKK